jgi:hypothetical protein
MADYVVETEIKDIIITAGDTRDYSQSQYMNDGSDPAYPKGDPHYLLDMTGMRLDMDIINSSGTVIRSLSTAGITPKITIATSSWSIRFDAFPLKATYTYDLQLTDGSDIMTIRRGSLIVLKQKTGSTVPVSVVPFTSSNFRIVERGGLLCYDKTLTVTGFAGTINVDWECYKTES